MVGSGHTLKVAAGFELPASTVTEVISVLATRGAGKSFGSADVAEELYAQQLQFVVVDPMGVYYGLRSSYDGTKKGLAIYLLGGETGDAPLEPTAGRLIADVVVDTGQSMVLDLSLFDSKAEQIRFMEAFAERLFYRKGPLEARTPLMLIVDEADEFAPQRPARDEAKMLAHMVRLAKRGRSRGIGLLTLTQRSAEFSKAILDLSSAVVFMRTAGPRDRKAIKDWMAGSAPDLIALVDERFPRLDTGEALIYSPHWLQLEQPAEIRFRLIKTFDSYKTPEPGRARAQPKVQAPIDIEALGAQIAATREKAKENDPAELRKRIRQLERTVRELEARAPAAVETIEVQVLSDAQIDALARCAGVIDRYSEQLRNQASAFLADIGEAASELDKSANTIVEQLMKISGARASLTAGGQALGAPTQKPPGRPSRADRPRRQPPAAPRLAGNSGQPPAGRSGIVLAEEVKLGKGERVVMDVLREWPQGRTQNELAFLAGYSARASTIGVILSNLRKAGYVEPGQPLRLTPEGLQAAGGPLERPTGQALLEQWLRHPRMGEGERRVLLELLDRYPNDVGHEQLCEATGYSPTASTMGVILSKLRKLGLVAKGGRRVSPEFYEAIR